MGAGARTALPFKARPASGACPCAWNVIELGYMINHFIGKVKRFQIDIPRLRFTAPPSADLTGGKLPDIINQQQRRYYNSQIDIAQI